ncbi:DUF4328 domain-containing protein [Aliibacillus thermotolerans]|uniref:DUF4328 domain-containing protein n=1 Tax=Aliibacillus thermotolerans TaxID=1834418 RepID=A0ABW0U4L8_9BACI|nr:DUF4328 domain-containing protein [Aliibacillus thermotolerans]MDA3129242.1 DUF4328 domain-containing protein [Aliibacillus thermotolerans]
MEKKHIYKSPKPISIVVMVFASITILFSIASIVASTIEKNIYENYDGNATVEQLTEEDFSTISSIVLNIDIPSILFFIAAIALYLVWIYRIHANGIALQLEKVRNYPGWAVTFYLLPLINMIVPLLSLLQIDKSSAKLVSEREKSPQKRKHAIIFIWWILFWTSYFVSLAGSFGGDETIQSMKEQVPFMIASEIMYIVSGLFFLYVIHYLTNIQVRIASHQKK